MISGEVPANLPDVNFLIALSWKNHVHHIQARRWFSGHRREPFAMCPITESGFIRLSMNPSVVGEAVSFETAAAALNAYRTLPNYCFWPLDTDFLSAAGAFSVTGYRQVTDAYLLGMAVRRGGRLLTFDRKIGEMVRRMPEYREHLILAETLP